MALRVERPDLTPNQIERQIELVNLRAGFLTQVYEPDMIAVRSLLKEEFVSCHVPVADGLLQGLFEDHLASLLPNLQQELFVLVSL